MLVHQLLLFLFVLLNDSLPRMGYLALYALLKSSEDGVPSHIPFGLCSGGLRHSVVVKGSAEG